MNEQSLARNKGKLPKIDSEHFYSTLKGRVVMAVFLAAVLPMVATIALVLHENRVRIEARELATLDALAQVTVAKIAEELEALQSSLREAVAMPAVASLLKGTTTSAEARPQLAAARDIHHSDDLLVVDANGQIIASAGVGAEARVAPEALQGAAQGRFGVAVLQDARTNKAVAQFAYPVRDNKVLGFVVLCLNEARLQHWVDKEVLPANLQQMYLVDANGQVITQPQLVKERLVLSKLPVQEVHMHAPAEKVVPGRYKAFGISVLGTHRKLGNVDWTLCVETDHRVVVDPAMRLGWLMLSVLAGGAVCAGLVAMLIGRRMETPIRHGMNTIDATMQQLNAGASQQAAGAQEQASSVAQIAATMDELSRTAEQIASNAAQTLDQAELGNQAFQDSLSSMSAVTQRVQDAARQILALGERSQRIGEISHIISSVADRIHLLALNAAIEAAGAGEYGRRFGVVASQVKELADATRQSSAQVQQLIDEMRNATNSAILVTEQATKQVESTSSMTDRASIAIEEIVQRVEAITLATQQQKSASDQVVLTMRQISDVSQQSAQGSNEILHSIQDLAKAMESLSGLVGNQGQA